MTQAIWQKIGTNVSGAQNAQEVLEGAGLNWEVETRPMFDLLADGSYVQSPDTKANYRMDNGARLGTIGHTTKVLQNVDAFKVFNPFIENDLMEFETAGEFDNGKKVFILGHIKGTDMDEIVPGDHVKRYVLFANSHDGTQAIRFGLTPIRVYCQNSLNQAIRSDKSALIRINHSSKVLENVEKVRDLIDLANQQFIATAEQFRELAKRDINSADLKKYVKIVFSQEKLDAEVEASEKSRQFENVQRLFEYGMGNNMPGVRGTLWAAYNAVVEYNQYEKGNSNTTEEDRLHNVWFGQSKRINERALTKALAMV